MRAEVECDRCGFPIFVEITGVLHGERSNVTVTPTAAGLDDHASCFDQGAS